jgi:hypothetical protein
LKPEVGWLELGPFSGDNERALPQSFLIERTQSEKYGASRVYVKLTRSAAHEKPFSWRVAAVVVRENGHSVLDDVIYLKDEELGVDDRLSKDLSAGCDGRRWIGFSNQQNIAGAQEPGFSAPSKEAIALAKKYLGTIEKSLSFPSTKGGRQDVFFIGQSLKPPRGWRTVVVSDQGKPRTAWDSFVLHDEYFDVIALSSINAEPDGHNGYIVTLRGCVPHQCSDGRIGFALFAAQNRQIYRAHVLTLDDNSYRVVYYPKSGIPDEYHKKLDQMMCSDNGISKPSALPLKCSSR